MFTFTTDIPGAQNHDSTVLWNTNAQLLVTTIKDSLNPDHW